MEEKDQKTVNFLEPAYESKTRLVKNGHTYKVILTWRGKTYMVQMFVPSVSRPTRQDVEKEIQKIYPDAKLMSFLPKDLEPGEPTVMMGENANDFIERRRQREIDRQKLNKQIQNTRDPEADKRVADAKKDPKLKKLDQTFGEEQNSEINKKIKNIKDDPRLEKIEKDPQGAEIRRKIEKETGTNIKPYTTTTNEEQDPDGITFKDVQRIKRQKQLSDASKKAPEVKNKIVPLIKDEFVVEDDMKGMSVKSGHKRPTKSGAGMTAKGVAAYRRRNPGSKLQTAVTGKVKKGSKDAKRRKSYCARSAGQMKKFPKAAKDPNSRLRQARRRWKC